MNKSVFESQARRKNCAGALHELNAARHSAHNALSVACAKDALELHLRILSFASREQSSNRYAATSRDAASCGNMDQPAKRPVAITQIHLVMFGVMTGNAYIDAKATFCDLDNGKEMSMHSRPEARSLSAVDLVRVPSSGSHRPCPR
jgi:hypothetical protein